MGPFGFVRIAAASPQVFVANPARNADAILDVVLRAEAADVIVLPELCITGYTCGDLFANRSLLDAALLALTAVVDATAALDGLVVVGLPLAVGPALYNVAAAVHQGRVLGVVPKQFLPNYREFYEMRWFRAADGREPKSVEIAGNQVPFGSDLLFRSGRAVVGVEICEDLWVPIPPSSRQAIAGANLLVNLSAGNEVVGKASWRRDLVISQSGRCIAAYAYAGAGPGESTTDVVFGGHCLIAENGTMLAQTRQIGEGRLPTPHADLAVADVDLDRLDHDRRVQNSFHVTNHVRQEDYRMIDFHLPTRNADTTDRVHRHIDPHPFVPASSDQLDARCAEIFAIQTAGLAKRVSRLSPDSPLVIGVSGGLDSTLALLAAVKACDSYGWPRTRVEGITMPGFGTSAHTRKSADDLMIGLGIGHHSVDIRPLCLETFRALGHRPLGIDVTSLDVDGCQQALMKTDHSHDLVFENVQARTRTLLLMSHGFVLGTGDMSEQALGWSTYNGDHMSMYNVNTSIPKTLVRFLVRYAADQYFEGPTRETLHRIADTPISPELLPLNAAGEIRQHTETTLGPYELHDFFLYHWVRFGETREKILFLASQAEFSQEYGDQQIAATLDVFIRRFFASQFKRSCVPDGPKVGTVSLSPRGDWRMPSDAEHEAF